MIYGRRKLSTVLQTVTWVKCPPTRYRRRETRSGARRCQHESEQDAPAMEAVANVAISMVIGLPLNW